MRGVGELAELAADEEGGLLADVDGVRCGAPGRLAATATVDVFVRKLRDKIDARSPRHTFIQTRYGVGYKLEAVPK